MKKMTLDRMEFRVEQRGNDVHIIWRCESKAAADKVYAQMMNGLMKGANGYTINFQKAEILS